MGDVRKDLLAAASSLRESFAGLDSAVNALKIQVAEDSKSSDANHRDLEHWITRQLEDVAERIEGNRTSASDELGRLESRLAGLESAIESLRTIASVISADHASIQCAVERIDREISQQSNQTLELVGDLERRFGLRDSALGTLESNLAELRAEINGHRLSMRLAMRRRLWPLDKVIRRPNENSAMNPSDRTTALSADATRSSFGRWRSWRPNFESSRSWLWRIGSVWRS